MSCRASSPAPRSIFVLLLLMLAASAGAPLARAQAPRPAAGSGPVALSEQAALFKRMEREVLLQGARRRLIAARAEARLAAREARLGRRHGARARRSGEQEEGGGPRGADARVATPSAALRVQAGTPLVPNVQVNDRAQDSGFGFVGQAEQMVAALGSNVLIAWNDGLGFTTVPTTNVQGYGYSVNGGSTFTDGGAPPTPAGWVWSSDPVVTVNEKTGDFWYCALVDVNSTQNGVAIARARFVGSTVQWSTPTLVRVASNSSLVFDKPWMVADSVSGRLYLTYTVFSTAGDTIVYQRSSGTTPLTAWDAPQRMSANGEAGLVQGSRPVVGPDGEVYVVWYSIGPVDVDFMRIRKSADQGLSFAAAVDVASVFANFGNGGPGFSRGIGITYPSIAVDRSHGAHRGRIYVAWNESVNYYDAALGGSGNLSETEVNDNAASADPFTVGQTVRGTCTTVNDFDYFRFNGTAGQTVVFSVDSLAAVLDLSLRVLCTDGVTRLAYSAFGAGRGAQLVFTLPATGAYYMRCVSNTTDITSVGPYRVRTGFDTPSPGERSRDHRDVFVAWSDGGATWSTPVRASDSPAGFDDWLPEVAVGGDNADPRVGSGRPYCLWYDWRDSPAVCGGASNVYLATSGDFGATWTTAGLISDTQTNWTNVSSNISPNQGDYLTLYANGQNIYAAWADGRNSDPDVFAVTVPLVTTPVEVALTGVEASPGRVILDWYAGAASGFSAAVERRGSATDFAAIGRAQADGSGDVRYEDATVTSGTRYAYRLSWLEGGILRTTPETWVDVPLAATFALHGARPNPSVRGVFISLSLPDGAPADLELVDVAGRRLATRTVSGAGEHLVDLSQGLALEPGVYLVRLTRSGRSLTTRVTIVR
jgi:hypothetical protein